MEASSSKALVIKLIFEITGERSNSPKIRKLQLEETETPTLSFLCESFSLQNCQTFYYYDDDGDQITIFNDRELLTAIKEKKSSDTLRLYTNTEFSSQGKTPSKRHEEEGFFEEICSNCQNRIGRFSYKCVICSGVELCGRCEAFGVHSAHDIIRLSNENTYPSQFFMRLHRLYDKMNQTQSMISLHPLSSPPPQSTLPPLGTIPSLSPEPLSKPPEDFDLIEPISAPLTVKQLSKSEESLNSEPKAKSPPEEEEEQEAIISEATPTYRGVLQAPVTVLLKDEFQVHEAREANSEEIAGSLRGLRKEIDKLLIDEEDRKSTSKESSSSKCTLAKMDSSGNDSSCCPYDLIKVLSFEESGEEFSSDKLEVNPSSSSLEEDSEETESPPPPPVENNIGDHEEKIKSDEERTPSSHHQILPEGEAQKSSQKLKKSSYDYVPAYCPRTRNLLNESSLYSLKYNQSPYLTTTQKVSDSLEQMKAMGFTDDDGWLTQVLTMERGDIDKVLDILTPVNK